MHVHIGFVPFIITGAYIIVWLFVMQWIAATWPDSAIGKAFAVVAA